MDPFCHHRSPKCQVLNKSLIQFSQQIHEIEINFYFPGEEQRRVGRVKGLDQVHKGSKNWAENSDPSRSVSKVHALATLPSCLPPLCPCTTMLWAFVGPLSPPNLQTPCFEEVPAGNRCYPPTGRSRGLSERDYLPWVGRAKGNQKEWRGP